MPKVSNTPQEKPWCRISSNWAWITAGVFILACIIVNIVTDLQEKRAKNNRPQPRRWYEVMTPEERHSVGLDKTLGDPNDWKPDPEGAQRFKDYIQKGGNADPLIDRLNDVDFYDIIDQMGGEEGF